MWVAVVGPSGAGKDTLLDGARRALAGDARFHFARRVVSRPAEAGGEAHEFLPAEAFDAADLVLRWEAHGLRYGIRRAEVERAPVTILNLSRRVLGEAAALHPLRVAEVTAPREVLRVRLLARGREGAAEVEGRLDRRAPLPAGLDVVKVPNDGTPAEGVARLCAVLEDAAAG
ncbi:MAG TPA: phosphonate metabolism protein/1,5-bisphosphokinase (PRPP-forming) PhnN [Roseococcus sp.]|jgi:phosphonate metabolism protein PhnN/1,5-bisphosphokinase (PRPP-forming)|nr:phosphonate metabolism protein/1,5-bisphosphokinase (PRPP-forming) PhnN [Roseococcus sp.]